MITVPKLEMHVTDVCNLRCEGCNHFANYRNRGVLPLDEGRTWLESWAARLAPVNFSLLGGEPLMNPELPDYLSLTRRLWPHTRIRLVTNGLLLPSRPDLWPALERTRTTLTISLHSNDPRYRSRLQRALDCVAREEAKRQLRVDLRNSIDGWYRPYRGSGREMLPYDDGNPGASWNACSARHCVTLRDNALWKCPPVAHLRVIAPRFGLDTNPAWAVPLAYHPLNLDADDDVLRAFFARGAEPVCGMCPSRPEVFVKTVF